MSGILVGVDGSQHSRAALRWAIHEAVQHHAPLTANEAGETPPEIYVSVARGDPAAELVKASRDADTLVVGSRGSGRFARLLMGSVSTKVTHHAVCPVVVVHRT
jgi:nucleotide-binding universal stress UspA family protein